MARRYFSMLHQQLAHPVFDLKKIKSVGQLLCFQTKRVATGANTRSHKPPKRIEAGERAIAVDGSDYLFWMARERGAPIEVVHAVEGTPQISNPMAIFKSSPNPNAARLLVGWIMSPEGQEFIVNVSGQYPANKLVKAKAGRPALASIKTLPEDPAEVEKTADEIKTRYQRYFKV